MPSFGKKSKKELNTCDVRLQMLAQEAIKIIDFSVLQGHRTEEQQNEAYAKGNSKVKYPNSKHNKYPSLAFDVAPYPIDFNDRERFVYLAGILLGIASTLGYQLRWGGDWDQDRDLKDQTFNDLMHFEIVE